MTPAPAAYVDLIDDLAQGRPITAAALRSVLYAAGKSTLDAANDLDILRADRALAAAAEVPK
jgi:hypothetical protein